MTIRQSAELLLLAALWGASFLFMRIGVPEFGPFAFMTVRITTAALVLLPLVLLSKAQLSVIKTNKKHLFIVGLTNTAIPFVLFGYAALNLSAGMSSVLNATTPMLAAIVAFLWLRQKLQTSAVIGLAVGFFGVLVLTLDNAPSGQSNDPLAILAIIGATTCYGIAASYTKLHLNGVKAVTITAGSLTAASLALIPFGILFWPQAQPSLVAWSAVTVLGIICTAFALILYFRLLEQTGPAKAVSVTYLIPVFGIVWGIIFLGERFSITMLFGAILILTGVSMTTGLFAKLARKKT